MAVGSGALSLIKYGEGGAIRPTVSGIGLTRCLIEGIVMVSETRVVRTGERWIDQCFNRGCRRIPLRTLQRAVGSLRHAECVRRGLHAAYSALNRFLTSSEDSPYFAEPSGTSEDVDCLYHLLWGWVEVIRLDLADPSLWKAAMTTTSLRAFSLRERIAILGFTDNLFVIAGDSNEHVLFTLDASEKRCSFVFWTYGMEERVLESLKLLVMPVDEESGMIIVTKELVGPVVAVGLWGTSHQGQTAVVINDNQNTRGWITRAGVAATR